MKATIICFETVISEIDNDCLLRPSPKYTPQWRIHNRWTRWKEYSNNGHGGNTLLKALIDKNGIDYANNFQFSILETRSMNAESDEVIKRESFWKDILLSREFGYNKN